MSLSVRGGSAILSVVICELTFSYATLSPGCSMCEEWAWDICYLAHGQVCSSDCFVIVFVVTRMARQVWKSH